MSKLTDWIDRTLYPDPKGEILVGDLHAAFTRDMAPDEREEWSPRAIECAMSNCMMYRGRPDSPARFVCGWSFNPPAGGLNVS